MLQAEHECVLWEEVWPLKQEADECLPCLGRSTGLSQLGDADMLNVDGSGRSKDATSPAKEIPTCRGSLISARTPQLPTSQPTLEVRPNVNIEEELVSEESS